MKTAESSLPRFALSVPEMARALGVTQVTVYQLIERGLLRTFVVNRHRLGTPDALAECVKRLQADGSPLAQDRADPPSNTDNAGCAA